MKFSKFRNCIKVAGLFLFFIFHCQLKSQIYWPTHRLSIGNGDSAEIGTNNERALNMVTNDTVRASFSPEGLFKISHLQGKGYRLVYVDSLGNLCARGGGGPGEGAGEGGHNCDKPYANANDPFDCPSLPCIKNSAPWFEGGNIVGNSGNNTAGTCNDYDFILKANGNNSIWIKPSGRVCIGHLYPRAKFQVYENSTLGTSAGAKRLLRSYAANIDGTDTLEINLWILRKQSGTDWTTSVWHDGISKNDSYLTPGTDTKTWWERNPNEDIQSWGNDGTAYMRLVQGNLYLGPQSPKTAANGGIHSDARLAVSGKILAKEIFVNIHTSAWADYVFEKEYQLMSLSDVKMYIEKNKHLPDIPSAQELENNDYSLDIAKMQSLQMAKIEELFLHLIKQETEIKDLKKENQILRDLIASKK